MPSRLCLGSPRPYPSAHLCAGQRASVNVFPKHSAQGEMLNHSEFLGHTKGKSRHSLSEEPCVCGVCCECMPACEPWHVLRMRVSVCTVSMCCVCSLGVHHGCVLSVQFRETSRCTGIRLLDFLLHLDAVLRLKKCPLQLCANDGENRPQPKAPSRCE